MIEPNEFKAYFTLTGDFEPADITAQIGLEPSFACRKDEPFGHENKAVRKFSRWSVDSRLPSESFLEEHVVDVLAQLAEVKDRVAGLESRWEPHVVMTGFFSESASGIFLKPETLSSIAEMKLGLDIRMNYEGGDGNANILQ